MIVVDSRLYVGQISFFLSFYRKPLKAIFIGKFLLLSLVMLAVRVIVFCIVGAVT